MTDSMDQDRYYRLFHGHKDALKDPNLWLEDFCNSFPLSEARVLLWEFFKSYLEDPDGLLQTEERNQAMFFYESMDKLLEAVYLLQQGKQDDADNEEEEEA